MVAVCFLLVEVGIGHGGSGDFCGIGAGLLGAFLGVGFVGVAWYGSDQDGMDMDIFPQS